MLTSIPPPCIRIEHHKLQYILVHTHTHTHTHMHARTHTHTPPCIRIEHHKLRYVLPHTHTHTPPCISIEHYILRYVLTHSHTHTYTHRSFLILVFSRQTSRRILSLSLWFLSFSLPSLYFFLCISLPLCISLSISLSVSLSISLYLSLYLSVCISLCISLCLYLSLSLSVSLCISLYLSLCLSLYLSLSLTSNELIECGVCVCVVLCMVIAYMYLDNWTTWTGTLPFLLQHTHTHTHTHISSSLLTSFYLSLSSSLLSTPPSLSQSCYKNATAREKLPSHNLPKRQQNTPTLCGCVNRCVCICVCVGGWVGLTVQHKQVESVLDDDSVIVGDGRVCVCVCVCLCLCE